MPRASSIPQVSETLGHKSLSGKKPGRAFEAEEKGLRILSQPDLQMGQVRI